MRFIHISDLHLGKRVNEFSMLEDQKYILERILEIIDDNKVECVLIAGDVYDRSVPQADAVLLFDDFLTSMAEKNISVCVISGNHDSPERLSFGSRLMKGENIYISPLFMGVEKPVELNDKNGKINVYMIPFIKPGVVRHVYNEADIESYNEAFQYVAGQIKINREERNILMAHQFVTGAGKGGSEDISVGGLDNVDLCAFDGFDYVALGHIHNSQTVGRETVRYCGTPLKYSVSESGQEKSVIMIDMEEKGNIAISKIPLKPLRDLRCIKGTYMEVTSRDFYKGTNTEDYIHITLTDKEDIPDAIGKLRVIYPNIISMDYKGRRRYDGESVDGDGIEKMEAKTPLELLQEFYRFQRGESMSEEQINFADSIVKKIWEENI